MKNTRQLIVLTCISFASVGCNDSSEPSKKNLEEAIRKYYSNAPEEITAVCGKTSLLINGYPSFTIKKEPEDDPYYDSKDDKLLNQYKILEKRDYLTITEGYADIRGVNSPVYNIEFTDKFSRDFSDPSFNPDICYGRREFVEIETSGRLDDNKYFTRSIFKTVVNADWINDTEFMDAIGFELPEYLEGNIEGVELVFEDGNWNVVPPMPYRVNFGD